MKGSPSISRPSPTPDAQNEHLAKLAEDLKQGWTPDLPRLESLTDIHQMTPRDYRESWAWVHLMLADSRGGKPLLIDYLTQGRTGARPQPLSQLLSARGTSSKSLLTHLETVQTRVMARQPEPPSQDRLIRSQEGPPSSRIAR